MPFSTWKAMLYKSFSIYKNRYVNTILDILWPCIILVLVIYVMNLTTAAQQNYTRQNSERNPWRNQSQVERLRINPWNSFNDYERNRFHANKNDGHFAKPKVHRNNLATKEYLYKESNDDTNIQQPEYPNSDENQGLGGFCIIGYSSIIVLCYIATWSGAGTLAHAERMSGTVERMRMYAVSDWTIIFSYVVHAGIKLLFSALLFSSILLIRIGGPPVIKNIDYFSLFLTIMLLSIQATTFFLTAASFFNSTILRSMIGTAFYFYLFLWALNRNFSVTAQVFSYMFAPFCLVVTSGTACRLETSGGIKLKYLISATEFNDVPLLVIPLLMLFGSAVTLLIFFYLINIKPGPFGSAKPVYFIFPPRLQEYISEFYEKSKTKKQEIIRESLYEEASPDIQVGIKIENLKKQYGHITSLKNLSLNIYAGQITALLGHNGAGKTTTLSILSGMISPTSGSAFYQGYNIFSNLQRFRKDLGLCPQNDLLHPNLTVLNQLVFFGMLGGLSRKQANESADDLLKTVGIFEKKYVQVSSLSGGMKRKLCIALALLGEPRVVILDEPTSGVDPQSRREIWNVLLESRGDRIILLTTHFMEEADVLGDQIAIMNHGEIVCYGSTMFLKKHYGAGYTLTVSSDQEIHNRINEDVTKIIPEATMIGEHKEWIKFKLPFEKVEFFSQLLKSLESNDKISRIGINCTTMEDVYLKVEEEAGGEIPEVPESSYLQVHQTYEDGKLMVYIYRFLALVKKNMICTFRNWFRTLLVVVVAPPLAAYVAMSQWNAKIQSAAAGDFNEKMCPDPTVSVKAIMFSVWLVYVIFIISSTFSNFVHKERLSSVKHLILMTGISPVTYWISVLLSDAVIYLIFVFISWITFIILDSSDLFEKGSGIYVLFLVLFLSGMSMISSVYLITLLFKTMRTVVIVYFAAVFTSGFVGYFLTYIKKIHPYVKILKLQPVTATISTMVDFLTLAGKKQNCEQCHYDGCSAILQSAYLEDENLSNDLLYLALSLLLYLSIVILTDYGLFPFLWEKIHSLSVGDIDIDLKKVESDVAREKSRVDGLHSRDPKNEIMAVVDGLAKKYSRSMVAVVDVTFAVSKGECFGLLGVNGAGKSTTFNVLTGILYPTRGNFFLKGYSLSKNKRKCLSLIGYCPQHSALIDNLTARQMLTMFAKLRLVPPQHVDKEVNKWITLFGLDEYCDRPCKAYSGGNKRKLNTALAFIGDPSIILLDEPTTGVDPFVRRNLWSVIQTCGSTNQAIIISSHSMDECEAVCNRLTIMARGRMECIGNIQHLKALYGTGYVVKISLLTHTNDEVETLKGMMESNFLQDCELKDEHKVLLHYHIGTNTYRISKVFQIMEEIKKQSNIVKDYVITDSSLEEVFLGFAKKTE